jgi:tRNA threonylcarbamoyladenosine biosynthesis protein TsaE
LRWTSRSPEATRAAAAELARSAGARGLAVALVGPLGAGKTAFAKGLGAGLGLDPEQVASPTFVIASEYPEARGLRFAHVDLYRVGSEAELEAAGFRDLLAPGVLLAVEWAERFPAALPPDRLEVRIGPPRGKAAKRPRSEPKASGVPAGPPATHREIFAVALGPVAAQALARWRAALGRKRSGGGRGSGRRGSGRTGAR